VLVVAPHDREVQQSADRAPQRYFPVHTSRRPGQILSGGQLALRVAGEHAKAHGWRRVAKLLHQCQQCLGLLHRFAARKRDALKRLRAACLFKQLHHGANAHLAATKLVCFRIPAAAAIQSAALKIDHRAQSRPVRPVCRYESM